MTLVINFLSKLSRFKILIYKAFNFLAHFALAKGMAFTLPLLASYFLSSDLYAMTEWSMALASLMIPLLYLGTTGSIIQLFVIEKKEETDYLIFLTIVIATGSFIAAFIFSFKLTAAIVFITGFSTIISLISRAKSDRLQSVWADHASILLCFGIVSLVFLFGKSINLDLSLYFDAIIIFVIGFCWLGFWIKKTTLKPNIWARFCYAVRIGIPICFFSFTMIWIILSPRLLAGYYLLPVEFREFSIILRVSNVILLIHTLMTSALTARMHALPDNKYDYLAACIIAISTVLYLIWFFFGLSDYILIQMTGNSGSVSILNLLPCFITAWITLALLEGRVIRNGLATQSALLLMLFSAIFAVFVFFVKFWNLQIIITFAIAQIYGAAALIAILLYIRGSVFIWTGSVFFISVIGSSLLIFR